MYSMYSLFLLLVEKKFGIPAGGIVTIEFFIHSLAVGHCTVKCNIRLNSGPIRCWAILWASMRRPWRRRCSRCRKRCTWSARGRLVEFWVQYIYNYYFCFYSLAVNSGTTMYFLLEVFLFIYAGISIYVLVQLHTVQRAACAPRCALQGRDVRYATARISGTDGAVQHGALRTGGSSSAGVSGGGQRAPQHCGRRCAY